MNHRSVSLALTPNAAPPGRADERGSALAMALVFIVVVGVFGGSVLAFQDTAARVSTALDDKRTADLDADGALDTAIEVIRADRLQARNDSTGEGCADVDEADVLVEVPGIAIECLPEEDSGTLIGAPGAALADSTIVTLGGAVDDGNDETDSDDDQTPFCDDWHTSSSCEAGLFIGNTDGSDDAGGLIIAPTGSDSGKPLVVSNSSIEVKSDRPNRTLRVAGAIEARRSCDPDPGQIQADQLLCDTDHPGVTDDPPGTMVADPGYRHDLQQYRQLLNDDLGALRQTAPSLTDCQSTGYAAFHPGYYDSLAAINALMDDCSDALFWFQPGVYYFDFRDAGVGDFWRAPRDASQIVGGEPLGWETCASCAQSKRMVANGASQRRWSDDFELAMRIDETPTTATTSSTNQSLIKLTSPQTPVPERAGTAVTGVRVQIHHATPSPADEYATGYPRLVVNVPNVGSCTITLDRSNAPIDRTYDVTTCAGGSRSGSYPTAAGQWEPRHVNKLEARYEVKGATGPVVAELDGVEWLVDYTGRPAPDFPRGCDPETPGVELVFGGWSRINFNRGSGTFELCGRSSDANPIATAIYGLSPSQVAPPRTSRTRTHLPRPTMDGTSFFPADVDLETVAQIDCPDDAVAACDGHTVTGSGGDPVPRYVTSEPFGRTAIARLAVRLPDDLVPVDAYIDRVEIRIRHAEGPGNLIAHRQVKIGNAPWATLPASPSENTWADWTWGDGYKDGNWEVFSDPDWHLERDPTDVLSAPASLNGATVAYEVKGNGDGGPADRWARVDGIEITVEYRPAATLRPLRGCLTIRSAHNPASPELQGTHGTDWAIKVNGQIASDSAYTTGSPAGDQKDTGQCALVRSTGKTRFHVEGSMYAPTAAFDLSGNDNDASFASGGLVARHVTAWRWKKGGNTPAYGAGDTPRRNRVVTLQAVRDGQVLACAHVEFEDDGGNRPGKDVIVHRWIRHPETATACDP